MQRRISVTDKAIEEIKEYLLSGSIKSGEKLLTENELSLKFGIGRSTVREAVRTLKAMGYVDILPGKGTFAVITSKEEEATLQDNSIQWFIGNEAALTELQEVRYCIEPFAVRLAVGRITQVGITELENTLNEFKKAIGENNKYVLSACDERFHSIIIKESGNNLLNNIYKNILKLFKQYSEKSFMIHESLQNTVAEHDKIFQAIKNRAADAAENEMKNHLEKSIRQMKNTIETHIGQYK
ncbi:MAG: GntR domain protein [Clostridia bacterium]|nr:GntR domain protein [Clostridia bacterium]